MPGLIDPIDLQPSLLGVSGSVPTSPLCRPTLGALDYIANQPPPRRPLLRTLSRAPLHASHAPRFALRAPLSANVRLWRGFPLPLITISIVRTISFSIYSATKRILNSEPGTVENTTDASGKTPWINLRLGILNKDSTLDVALTSLLAGAASGAVVCVGSAPFELVKVGFDMEGGQGRWHSWRMVTGS